MESNEPKASPFTPMFEGFRAELDEHHDRRERIVKASRDITAASKKIIFALQRVRYLRQPLQQSIIKAMRPHIDVVAENFAKISTELQGVNYYKYQAQISGGVQEYLEALSFQRYLETQEVISPKAVDENLQSFLTDSNVLSATASDYILGLFDMTGELMRFSITSMATSGELPGGRGGEKASSINVESTVGERTVLRDLQELRYRLETLDSDIKGYGKKLEVTQASVEKVEKALYGLVVRGSERPKGWLPDLTQRRAEDVEVA